MRDHPPLLIVLAAAVSAALIGCGAQSSPTAPTALLAARGTDRPFVGSCAVTLLPRVHEEGESCAGNDGHDPGEDEGGGPPIGRHFDVSGSCQVSHLGRAAVSGRLNVTGPFGAGHGEEAIPAGEEPGHGQLAVRGRLLLIAANGDQLAGSYIPLAAVFTRAGDDNGGTLQFTATERFGESCPGHGEEDLTVLAGGEHEEPVSSGRFANAFGEATITGSLRIGSENRGAGQLAITSGLLSY